MLKAMRARAQADGRIALAEFRLEDRKVPIKLLHKMSKKQILKEFPPNGFKLVEQFDKLPWQHLMFFAVTMRKVLSHSGMRNRVAARAEAIPPGVLASNPRGL